MNKQHDMPAAYGLAIPPRHPEGPVMDPRADLEHDLERLGRTPKEVAAAIAAKGVRGVRNTVRQLNPVVRYTRNLVPADARSIDVVEGDRLRVTLRDEGTQEITLPPAIRQFLEEFNDGEFPDLELPT